jgi:hypothetical protein
MTVKSYIFYPFLLLLLWQCADKDDTIPSEQAQELRTTCQTNAYEDSLQIAKNLVGDWKLVGYGCGFCAPHEAPKVTLTLTPNTGILDLSNAGVDDTLHTFEWNLARFNIDTQSVRFRFNATPHHYALSMNHFCEEYMFFDNMPLDGQFMLFQKQ